MNSTKNTIGELHKGKQFYFTSDTSRVTHVENLLSWKG